MHLAEGGDAGDRLFAVGPGVGDGAEQLALDIDRAARPAGDDAALLQIATGEAGEYQVAAGAGIFQNAENLGVEFFDLRPPDYGLADAFHAWADVVDLPVGFRFGRGGG